MRKECFAFLLFTLFACFSLFWTSIFTSFFINVMCFFFLIPFDVCACLRARTCSYLVYEAWCEHRESPAVQHWPCLFRCMFAKCSCLISYIHWDHTLYRALVLLKQSPGLLGTILEGSRLRHRIPASWHSYCRPQKDDRQSQPHLVLFQQPDGILNSGPPITNAPP